MPSIFPIAWTFRWVFLTALLVPLCIASAVIIRQPEVYIVRSAVGLAVAFVPGRVEATNGQSTTPIIGRTQTIDPPDQIAKAAAEQYLPLALANAANGPGTALPDFRADAAGPSVVLTDSTTLAGEEYVKEIQRKVLDLIVKQQEQQADTTRESFAIKVRSAKRRIESYDEQIKSLAEQKREFKARVAGQRGLIDDIQSNLADTLKAISPDSKIQDVITGEAKVREFRERLNTEEKFSRNADFAQKDLGSEMANIVAQRDEQYLNVSQNEFQLNSIHNAQIQMQPTRMQTAKGAKRSLLLIASLVGSLIFAVFVVLMFDRFKQNSAQ